MAIRSSVLPRATLLALLLLTATARAEPADDERLRRGVELRLAGRDREALEQFRAAFASSRSVRAEAQMALAEQALGRWVAAEAHLREALSAASDPWIAEHAARLREALEQMGAHLGWLEVAGNVDGAEVLVGGEVVAALPMKGAVRVEVGTYPVEVRARDRYTVIKEVTVTSGGLARAEVVLRSLAPVTSAPPPAASFPPPMAAAATGPAAPTAPLPDPAWRALGFSLAGLSLAALTVGVGGLVARNSAASRYNDDLTCPGSAASAQPPGCQQEIDRVGRWSVVAAIGFSTGGVSALTALLAFRRGSTAAAGTAAGLLSNCRGGPGRLGLACGGAW